jgi:hypothetical protein
VREAREELGVEVELGELLHTETYRRARFLYFRATVTGGVFGTGGWPDHAGLDAAERERQGTFEPVWVRLDELVSLDVGRDVRPRELVRRLVAESS